MKEESLSFKRYKLKCYGWDFINDTIKREERVNHTDTKWRATNSKDDSNNYIVI